MCISPTSHLSLASFAQGTHNSSSKIPLSISWAASDSKSLLICVVEKQEREDIELSRDSCSSPLEEHNEVKLTLCLVNSRTGREFMDSHLSPMSQSSSE
jgi:hypothetical protein